MTFIKKEVECNRRNQYYDSILFTYFLFVALFAIGLFLFGFFPIKHHDIPFATMKDIPKTINDIKINSDHLYKPVVRKVVFMVIDALRWDFVKDAHKLDVMPFTRGSIVNKSACLLQVKVNAPTVTMPRVKAMTSGAVSSFIDVALNFGKTEVTTDSVLFQAKNHGHNLVFYGDDTWLKLYPDIFHRSEGTSSFFVSDYTEVDTNVTRYIYDELYMRNDWDIMVLHYLGLDHIGHVYGPRSPLIKPKLDEMDDVIREIATRVQQWNDDGVPSLLIVCGDHGMKNSGGHGGATPEETLVPLVAFGSTCATNTDNDFIFIDQVDIATTLAVMLGLPIPSSSIGSISLNMISNLPIASQLYILYYNAKSISVHFEKISDHKTHSGHSNYLDAIQMHKEWLSGDQESKDKIDPIIRQYNNALRQMKDVLVQSKIHYDLTIMSIAMVLMGQVIIIIIISNWDTLNHFSLRNFFRWWISGVGIWLLINCIFYYEDNDVSFTMIDNRLAGLIFIVFTVNYYWCTKISWPTSITTLQLNYPNVILVLAIVLYTVSLSSTSFIEEEHQTWYFFFATYLMFQLIANIRKLHISLMQGQNNIKNSLSSLAKTAFLLVVHRIIRKLNSTGNKYAHLPDIGGWLRDSESHTGISIVLLTALILLVSIGFVSTNAESRKVTLIFHLIISTCIYLRHASSDAVIKPFFYPESSGLYEVHIFWIAVIGFIFYSSVRNFFFVPNATGTLNHRVFYIIIQLWVMISALLHRPHNVILLPIQLMTSTIMSDLSRSDESNIIHLSVSYCLGNVFYFYQGNSNSLATVDVAAGYVGLQSFILPITTLFMCINTFSAPILAYLMSLYAIITRENDHRIHGKIFSINRRYTLLRFLPLTVYTIIITITRYHLFVWSVFSPKLLYEAMHFTALSVAMFVVQIIFLLSKNKNDW